jgi:hypothetical protein
MDSLSNLSDDIRVPAGSLIRLYGVNRYDLKHRIVKGPDDPNEADYYDYILVDAGVVSGKMFLIVNVSLDNSNKGSILCKIESSETGILLVSKLKEYFGQHRVEVSLNT